MSEYLALNGTNVSVKLAFNSSKSNSALSIKTISADVRTWEYSRSSKSNVDGTHICGSTRM
ncbi:hypothetical protein CY34DRAFT_812158 [Suillus luteus UH-Slu-Lm8-n1]|uniref:Uncharacterized protein n=1 Tax=Suillus luteus UH-Slu-Lm8-n1 TaxID=930992 RepID=A0A0D0AML3_9AGAM|nr:hypothetical protein CY34DRAFT_812158 [Suillus luteus UH-Slu-Lm8-n1]